MFWNLGGKGWIKQLKFQLPSCSHFGVIASKRCWQPHSHIFPPFSYIPTFQLFGLKGKITFCLNPFHLRLKVRHIPWFLKRSLFKFVIQVNIIFTICPKYILRANPFIESMCGTLLKFITSTLNHIVLLGY